jgi:hypothetical protein
LLSAFPAPAGLTIVSYREPESGTRERRRWIELLLNDALAKLVALGIRELCVPDELAKRREYGLLRLHAQERFFIHASLRDPEDKEGWRLPRATLLDARGANKETLGRLIELYRPFHLLFVPEDAPDPVRPGGLLIDRPRVLPFDDFLDRLNR